MGEARLTRRSLLGAVGAASLSSTSLAAAAASLPAASHDGVQLQLVVELHPAQAGAGNHRWARIARGLVGGSELRGRIEAGRVDWQVDPASGAAEAVAHCRVRSADGSVVELRREALAATRLGNGLVLLRACG